MAQVKIEEVIDYLDTYMKSALEDAVKRVLPNAQFDRDQLFRAFTNAVDRHCSTWEEVPDDYVEPD